MKIIHIIATLIAILFGLLTLFVGVRVLFLGVDPGYIVYKPLLIYNATMGLLYVIAGVTIWRNVKQGMSLAAIIFILNLTVLIGIYFTYTSGDLIAIESLKAIILRTGVWGGLFAALGWLNIKKYAS